MKTLIAAASALALLSGAAVAQTPAPAAPAAKPAPMAKTAPKPMGPKMSTAMTTPTKTAPAAMTTSKTTVKGPAMPRTAASLECSKQADAQNIHGKARKKMMSSCKSAAKKG